MTNTAEFNRYSCQIPLTGFGVQAQQKLKNAKVLVVGVGGLGCPVSIYLASAGVGQLGLADNDTVAVKNLHRQVLFVNSDVGKSKTKTAQRHLSAQNPEISVICHPAVDHDNVFDLIDGYDVVVDCTDNFETRYLLNDACVIKNLPLVYGSIYQYEGQVAVWNLKNQDDSYSSNYRDVFPEVDSWQIPDCADGGVLPTIGGIIGSLQASEVIKYITGVGDPLKNRLLMFDALSMSTYEIVLPPKSRVVIHDLPEPVKIKNITLPDLRRLQENKSVVIIDVRTKGEHREGNLGGKNIPLKQLITDHELAFAGQPVVFYCRSGKRSREAAKYVLQRHPKAEVMSLAGGVEAYR